jgi:alpha-L-fucosidase
MKAFLAAGMAVCICGAAWGELKAPADDGKVKGRSGAIPEQPLAPAEYRRPADYKPFLYKETLRQISDAHSTEMMARAAKVRAAVEETNARGKWKPTGASIDKHPCPEWFKDAKFGIFIDWGLWSLASWAPQRANRVYPDWYEQRMYSNYDPGSPNWGYRAYHIKNWGEDFQRDHFIPLFKAAKFNPDQLCELFKACGARYVVPFSKHHGGFCLWDSSFTFRDVKDMGPRRDLDGELVKACRKNGLKFGFYFSVGEWEYPVLRDGKLRIFKEGNRIEDYTPDMEYKASGKIAVKDFIRDYSLPQAAEFIDKYDPDILWYDYDWCDFATNLATYDISAYFYNKSEGRKDVAVNDRYGNGTPEDIAGKFSKGRPRSWLRTVRGDFFTDELGDTTECIDPAKYHPWEACQGISSSYGNNWQDNEGNVRSEEDFICMFADIVARGGNLLLLINLDGQGAIPAVQAKRLSEIGAWLNQYGEAIYATRVHAPFKTDDVDYTESKDGKTVYAIVKRPAATIRLAFQPGAGTVVSEIGAAAAPLAWQADGDGMRVALPGRLAKSPLPFALRLTAPAAK